MGHRIGAWVSALACTACARPAPSPPPAAPAPTAQEAAPPAPERDKPPVIVPCFGPGSVQSGSERPRTSRELDTLQPSAELTVELPPALTLTVSETGATDMDRVLRQSAATPLCKTMGAPEDARQHRFEIPVKHRRAEQVTLSASASELDHCLAHALCDSLSPNVTEDGTFRLALAVSVTPRPHVTVATREPGSSDSPNAAAAVITRLAAQCTVEHPTDPAPRGELVLSRLTLEPATPGIPVEVHIASSETRGALPQELVSCVRSNVSGGPRNLDLGGEIQRDTPRSFTLEWRAAAK